MTALSPVAQRFPLVPRSRPSCAPLAERVAEVRDLAEAAAARTGSDALALAATAANRAALIASDCGLPDLARHLCWRHFDAYAGSRPLMPGAGRYALEPLVNLARLSIRANDGGAAHRLLFSLHHALATGESTQVGDRIVSLLGLVSNGEDRETIRRWLWGVVLAEGVRALVRAGRWTDAQTHAEQLRGVGQRLLDGRQVAVLARCSTGDTDGAVSLLGGSTLVADWEHSVAACLRVLCLRADGRPSGEGTAAMIENYFRLPREPELLMFRTTLGLGIVDLIADSGQYQAGDMANQLIDEIVSANDAYPAREVLRHSFFEEQLTERKRRTLMNTVEVSGLGRGQMPPELRTGLLAALTTSKEVVERFLLTVGRGGTAGTEINSLTYP
jgi:hypothetical protein